MCVWGGGGGDLPPMVLPIVVVGDGLPHMVWGVGGGGSATYGEGSACPMALGRQKPRSPVNRMTHVSENIT